MLALIAALNSEAEKVIEVIDNKSFIVIAGKKAVKGTLFGKDVVLAVSGVGKVNAAMTAQVLIDGFAVDCVFNFGTAGGADESVKVFSYYLVSKVCQYDFDVTEIDDVSIGYIETFGRVFFETDTDGIEFFEKKALATADRFSNKPADIETVRKLGCNLRDMEGGAIAEVCTANGIPLIMLKGVTDTYDNPAYQYLENNRKVCEGFPCVIEKILKQIK